MEWITSEAQPQFIQTRKNLGRTQRRVNYDIQQTDEGYRYHSVELAPNVWSYDAIVDAIVTAEYPTDRMWAVINNYLLDPSDEQARTEMHDMQACRAKAKKIARQALSTINPQPSTNNGLD